MKKLLIIPLKWLPFYAGYWAGDAGLGLFPTTVPRIEN